ncbi:MAG: hypothetical protein V4440_12480 [Pseudomonadota bacterium]
MADTKPNSHYYQLKGVNQKVSTYEFPVAEFLDLKNVDFDVPNALQKRPGSTYAIAPANGTSGPIKSLFEFSKLTGESYMIAASDTALFYMAANAYTTLATGWNNGQPPDMLTFTNKLWVANGQNWSWWNGSSFFQAGLPVRGGITTIGVTVGWSIFTVLGATHYTVAASYSPKALFLAYSYIRSDGYYGPCDLQSTARNVVRGAPGNATGLEYFSNTILGSSLVGNVIAGFSSPAGFGISQIYVWAAADTIPIGAAGTGTTEFISTALSSLQTGSMGWLEQLAGFYYISATLKPTADLTKFRFFTNLKATFAVVSPQGFTSLAATLFPSAVVASFPFTGIINSTAPQFTGMIFPFFDTYIPKYVEVNQNSLFLAGFSNSPSTVWFSEVGSPEFYDPESTFEVRTNDGDKIYGIKSYNNTLLVFKEHSFHKLIGDNADNYQLIQVSSEYGCISRKSIVAFKQAIMWLDKKGIMEYNGASYDIISDKVEGVFRRLNVAAAKDQACAVHHVYRNQIWFGIPVDNSTTNNLTVVYDYLVDAWTFFDGFNPASYAYAYGAQTRPTVYRGDYSGLIHYTSASFYSDSGQGITCFGSLRFENTGGENQTTLWRRLFLDVSPNSSGVTGAISGQLFTNYDSSTVQGTFMVFQNQYQTRVEMGVQGKAVSAQFSHNSASLPLLINGYGWANRGLRNV